MENWLKTILYLCLIFLPPLIFPILFGFEKTEFPKFGIYMMIYYAGLLAFDLGYKFGKDKGREEIWQETRNK